MFGGCNMGKPHTFIFYSILNSLAYLFNLPMIQWRILLLKAPSMAYLLNLWLIDLATIHINLDINKCHIHKSIVHACHSLQCPFRYLKVVQNFRIPYSSLHGCILNILQCKISIKLRPITLLKATTDFKHLTVAQCQSIN